MKNEDRTIFSARLLPHTIQRLRYIKQETGLTYSAIIDAVFQFVPFGFTCNPSDLGVWDRDAGFIALDRSCNEYPALLVFLDRDARKSKRKRVAESVYYGIHYVTDGVNCSCFNLALFSADGDFIDYVASCDCCDECTLLDWLRNYDAVPYDVPADVEAKFLTPLTPLLSNNDRR